MSKEFTKSYAINRIAELNEQIVEMTAEQSETMRYLNKLRDNNKQLKQQLEEKDKLIEFGREEIRKRNKRIDEIVERDKKLFDDKNKEIEKLRERLSVFDNFKDNYGYTNYDDSEILEDLQSRAFQAEDDTQIVNELLQFFNIFDENELVDKVKEPQTKLAIQELEKVKEEFGLKSGWSSETDMCFDLEQFIKQQIEELKGE